jgi:hypothetical protein
MSLDKFTDATLTRAQRSESGLWYAVIDHAPAVAEFSWLDFSSCSSVSEAAARSSCAAKIRADANGIGKYAPHDETRADSCNGRSNREHWRKKQYENQGSTRREK